ncbi:hypothetical protein NG827_14750 [Xanthomonas sacchari]|uniref:hypothetical protein n=1 Tax=Xanthomonas sacchari TaxID=56458 RepID=UPI00225C1EA8|nr:hypothetical protein [Xanthomonas sacchari]UYK83718.1 hypothetical protein NG827_14750 [Xanthomonas sacchari]
MKLQTPTAAAQLLDKQVGIAGRKIKQLKRWIADGKRAHVRATTPWLKPRYSQIAGQTYLAHHC